ncbi:ABC transporter permease [bacterium]|nr:ABC transporter permease [bacterium]
MTGYVLRRLAGAALLVLALLTAVFFLVRLAPGDPAELHLDPDLGDAQRAQVRARLGLDAPLHVQYLRWLDGVLLHGDLGRSLQYHRPVTGLLGEAIPNTLLLTVSAYVVHLALALLSGVWMARRRGTRAERAATVGALTLYSLPAFWLGLMLILVFSRALGWLPAGGLHAPDAALMSWPARLWDTVRHLVLPVVVLGVASAAGTARYLRSSLVDVLASDYILAARARGLSERAVVCRHAVRNAPLPAVTLAGLNPPFLLGGAVVTETVFAWPGMGRLAVDAIYARDYPLIMGATALSAVMVVLGNLLADLAYGWVDPRIRLGGRGRS